LRKQATGNVGKKVALNALPFVENSRSVGVDEKPYPFQPFFQRPFY